MRPEIGYVGYNRSPWDRWTAYLCSVFYLLAGIAVLTWILPGRPLLGETLYSISFVARQRFYWRLAWMLVLAATTLQFVLFCIVTTRVRPGAGPLSSSALVVAGFGVLTVWFCALVGILQMPALAADLLRAHLEEQPTNFRQHHLFVSMQDRMDQYLYLVGNTFLWGAGLLLTLLCLRDRRCPRWILAFGLWPCAAGALATAGNRVFYDSAWMRLYGTVAYIPLFALWSFFLGFFYLDAPEAEGAEDSAAPPAGSPHGDVLHPRLRGG